MYHRSNIAQIRYQLRILLCLPITLFIINSHANLTYADITLIWDPPLVEDITGYIIYFSENAFDNYQNPAGWTTESTSFTIKNPDDFLKEDTLYYFAVSAYNSCGNESEKSEYVEFLYNKNELKSLPDEENKTFSDPSFKFSGSGNGCFISIVQ